MDAAAPPDAVLVGLHREEHTRLLALLVRRFGDLDLAEDAAQEAMEAALRTWPRDGVPASPLAWLTRTAQNRALDRVRSDAAAARRLARLRIEHGERAAPPADAAMLAAGDLPDDRLAMLMGSCHPALAPADRIALMLRFVGGLTTAEVAEALLIPVPTLQARITRAKARIRRAGIPLRVPEDPAERAGRLPLVLTAISLVFTEGYAASSGDSPLRAELTGEAIRLARILHRLEPGSAEATGLLALLLLTEARAPARLADGLPVPLEEQDRSRWDRDLLAEGIGLAERAAAAPGAGRWTIQAAIAAVHGEAADFAQTDWAQIVALYDLLLHHDSGPVVRMNRAVAVGRRDGMAAGLVLLDGLGREPELARHHPYHLARAITLEELGRRADAAEAYRAALALVGNAGERELIRRRLGGVEDELE
ncbi:RNA polymerase sigma factor [Brachybacterium hainanense]|uniref:RNA polymerase sigma factor n=1 Tax=Brachybacterium hainanense TaxID=1541174 RepID=A0ABV6R9N5_9MICO